LRLEASYSLQTVIAFRIGIDHRVPLIRPVVTSGCKDQDGQQSKVSHALPPNSACSIASAYERTIARFAIIKTIVDNDDRLGVEPVKIREIKAVLRPITGILFGIEQPKHDFLSTQN
jgi:hypothetical protein